EHVDVTPGLRRSFGTRRFVFGFAVRGSNGFINLDEALDRRRRTSRFARRWFASKLEIVMVAPEDRERPIEDRDLVVPVHEQCAACVIDLVARAEIYISQRFNDVE